MQDNAENKYIIDPEMVPERYRLMLQEKYMEEAMGGIIASDKRPFMDRVTSVLDAGCGPGGWVLEMARQYPHIHVYGIDISHEMIEYAKAQAKVLGRTNATFEVVNIRNFSIEGPFLKGGSFDFVNIRLLSAALTRKDWPVLLEKCRLLLNKGGMLCWSEADVPQSSSAAYNEFYALLSQALYQSKQTYSVDGRSFALIPNMNLLLQDAGYKDIEVKAYVLDASFYTSFFKVSVEISMSVVVLFKPLLIKAGLLDEARFEVLYAQMEREFQDEKYVALSHMISLWAHM